MEIIWQPKAEQRLKEIYSFYREKSRSEANKLLVDIKNAVFPLVQFPQMAALEPYLSDLPVSFRSLVVRDNYKIIYFIDEDKDIINIVTIWDCRQDDKKLKNELG
ncbi:type II toxin-antitoxin system RelE/ParE family toxin [Parabacteroides sp. Marseille-P3160]|uniref:type II toxin-antitoxin system RelE/ParE family toxin n=1 Tax=Parabacteroides sp. Marseille-P3160 TaxID=1917887 RepID=UPI0009B9676E|nr:type II toxin-antitoxin system RelE/ParE family toxin [Parabacteroides sp. Marseille-P3160]